MTQENHIRVPQALLDSFAQYGLELPPLPLDCLDSLIPVGGDLFTTNAPPAWVLRGTPEFLSFADLEIPATTLDDEENESWAEFLRDVLADGDGEDDGPDSEDAGDVSGESGETSGEMPYFLCGFSGSGLQDRVFLYSYSSRGLRIGITIPFNRAYADPERERENLNRIMELLLLVLQCTREGANLGTDGTGTFFWINDWRGSSFQLRNGNGEVVLKGDSTEALLDYLEQRRDALSEDAVPVRLWVKI